MGIWHEGRIGISYFDIRNPDLWQIGFPSFLETNPTIELKLKMDDSFLYKTFQQKKRKRILPARKRGAVLANRSP